MTRSTGPYREQTLTRYAQRVDANHKSISKALEAMGFSVQSLHKVGGGCPDILSGFRNQNLVFEIKDGEKPPSARVLTPHEVIWHRDWKGQKAVVNSLEEVLDFMEAWYGIPFR